MHTHDGYVPHSHEVRADHEGVTRYQPRQPDADLFRSQIAPGLAVVTNGNRKVCVEVGPPFWQRRTVPDPALLVTAVETARDVGAGGPSVGSLNYHVALRLARICEDLDTAL